MTGKTVTRAELAEVVYQEVGLSRNESAGLVEDVLSEISDMLVRGEPVKLSSFGSFSVRQKGERKGRNPKTGEEVPIMDGSAAPFVDLINSVGIIEQQASRHFLMIKRELKVKQGDAEAILRPFKGFKATYTFAADHPVYNRYPKVASIDFSSVSYVDEVSQARSFGLCNEFRLEKLLTYNVLVSSLYSTSITGFPVPSSLTWNGNPFISC